MGNIKSQLSTALAAHSIKHIFCDSDVVLSCRECPTSQFPISNDRAAGGDGCPHSLKEQRLLGHLSQVELEL